MNFNQLLKHMNGTSEVDEEKKKEILEGFKRDCPYGVIKETDTSLAVWVDEEFHCMKCGTKMNNRTNQTVKKGEWVPLKRKNNISNWECPKCRPLVGNQPLGVISSEHLK